MGTLLALILLAACRPSQVTDPDADITVSGVLYDSGGHPVPGTEVRLSFREYIFTLPPSPDITLTSTTDPAGRYSFALKGRDLNYSNRGGARIFRLRAETTEPAPGGGRGSRTTTSFRINREQLPIDLRLWDDRLSLDSAGLTWSPLGPEYGGGSGYSLVVDGRRSAAGSDHRVWSAETDSASLGDLRVLEDTEGKVFLSATRQVPAPGTRLSIEYEAAVLPYRSPAGAPLSRGKPCWLDQGGKRKQPPTGCPVTDGNHQTGMQAEQAPESSPDAGPAWIVIDLEELLQIDLVVVRHCECPVEVSADGSAWSPAGTIEQGALVLDPPPATRFVRVGPGSGSIEEISIWPAR